MRNSIKFSCLAFSLCHLNCSLVKGGKNETGKNKMIQLALLKLSSCYFLGFSLSKVSSIFNSYEYNKLHIEPFIVVFLFFAHVEKE